MMIRTFRSADLTEIMHIWLSANLKAHDFIPADYWESHFEQVRVLLPAAELYIYEEDAGALCGFIGMSGDYIAGIFVKEGARSGGIGKQLLDYVKSFRQSLTLNVYRKNERAVRFYLRENFTVRSQRLEKDTGEEEYLMEWKRSSDP